VREADSRAQASRPHRDVCRTIGGCSAHGYNDCWAQRSFSCAAAKIGCLPSRVARDDEDCTGKLVDPVVVH